MKKRMMLTVIAVMVALFMSANVSGEDKMTFKKANGYVQAGMINQAVDAFNQLILDEPTNADYHFQLGVLYAQFGNVDSAKIRFASAAKLSSKNSKKIGEICKQIAESSISTDTDKASKFFAMASDYDTSLKSEACNFFIRLGDGTSDVSKAKGYYTQALNNCGDAATQKKIAGKYLRLAAMDNGQKESLIQLAKSFGVDEAFIKKVFPDSYEKVVYEKTFSDADIDSKRGNIAVFTWSEQFKVGDIIYIDGQIPEGAPEIEIHRGKNFNPEWLTTTNGKFEFPIKQVPASGTYCLVWIEKDKNIKFTIKVKREIHPEANTSLLASL
jgi:tetratricopeptide (TPR) repeat protein